MKAVTKRIIAILSAACMLSFLSCSEKEESSAPSEAATSSTGEIEFVTDAEDPDLGAYTVSSQGTKLYYEPEDVSHELMAALEKYFITFSQRDYETYESCIHPEYLKEMTEYLEEDFGYDLKTSFESQCDNLETNSGGEFTVTRIRAELPEVQDPESCLSILDDVFGTEDFYGTIEETADELHHLVFYIISEAEGVETLLISEFEIVFAEIDGKYYTFG